MRTLVFVLAAGAIAVTSTILVTSTSGAATGTDLTMKGNIFGGATATVAGQEAVFQFVLTNNGPATASVDFDFTVVSGADGFDDMVGRSTSTNLMIHADGNFCEPGDIKAGKSTTAGLLVVSPTGPGT